MRGDVPVREETMKKRRGFRGLLAQYPVRHGLLALGLLLIGAYFALRENRPLMVWLSEKLVQPAHRALSALWDSVPFSGAELIYGLLIVGVSVYIIYSVVQLIRRPERLRRLYGVLIALLALGAMAYGGFCLLWGVYYYGDSFTEKAGLREEPVSVEQLEAVTIYFAELANRYSDRVPRDEAGSFSMPREEILERGAGLYRNVEKRFPALAGESRRPKPIHFSRIMSYLQFTGFFFPFTGEANLNMDSPAFMLPSTVAHELAHQRGVAREQEANFAAVAACLDSGEDAFVYSAAMLAYVHLGNALHDGDYARWEAVYDRLNGQVRRDFAENRAYWAEFEDTVAEKVSDAVYEGFLESYGQTLGLRSYGACVDLLVAYYYEDALEAME